MMRPFEGIKVVDLTHVLAGPFATYQLAVLGADVIKVENPESPDQARGNGTDQGLNDCGMGTDFLTQASNKRAITVNLKTGDGREIFRRLLERCDVFVENYRPGALQALDLGYEAVAAFNPRMIYCSMSAFGQAGPRGQQTAYDHVIQATSGIMAMTGTPEVNPIKFGPPAIDYAVGTMGAFAISSALFQRERTGRGQHIDLAMFDVSLMLMGSHVTAYLRDGTPPHITGNNNLHATNSCYETKNGLLMLGASNLRQQRRFWLALGRPDLVKNSNRERVADRQREAQVISAAMLQRTAEEWETFFQSRHVPAGRVRRMVEALDDPQLATRRVVHRALALEGLVGSVGVPVAAFKFAHGGPSLESAPRKVGADTDLVLSDLGYSDADIARFRSLNAI